MHLIWMGFIGLIVGVLAWLSLPSKSPGRLFAAIILGLVGSYGGGYAAWTFWVRRVPPCQSWRGLVGAGVGAVVIMAIYRMVLRRPRSM